jgi:hypothetical protein
MDRNVVGTTWRDRLITKYRGPPPPQPVDPPHTPPIDVLEDSGGVLEVILCSGLEVVEMVIPTQDRKFGNQPLQVFSSSPQLVLVLGS